MNEDSAQIIIIIDKNPDDRAVVKNAINQFESGYEILEAGTAKEGLSLIHKTPEENIACIFLDDMLPDQDGVSVIKEIYDEDQDIGPCPMIMLTGQGSEDIAIEAIRFGLQDYIMKDAISKSALRVAMIKARQIFELKREHNQAKAFLEHSQKMDAVGKLAGGIAHDFNNLLTITFGNTRILESLVQAETMDREKILEKLEIIQRAMKRGADLVKKLMLFSRQRELEPALTDTNKLIEDLKEFLGRTLGEQIEIETIYETDPCPIYVDPGQLEHAIINMGVNARDAMYDGGTLTLQTQNINLNEEEAAALNMSPGSYLCLNVADTGTGIDEEVLEKVFDPFFTTKETGKGTGLGLSMVYGFIEGSNAFIRVTSQKGEGTRFSLYFPEAENIRDFAEGEDIENAAADEAGSETILMVEDEEEIRSLTAAILRQSGYTILEAGNGSEALELLKQEADRIQLVFTDISMPGEMNGVQMAARAQTIKPDVKLLFTSGYAAGSVPDMSLIENYPIVHKPYQPEELKRKLREIFDEAP